MLVYNGFADAFAHLLPAGNLVIGRWHGVRTAFGNLHEHPPADFAEANPSRAANLADAIDGLDGFLTQQGIGEEAEGFFFHDFEPDGGGYPPVWKYTLNAGVSWSGGYTEPTLVEATYDPAVEYGYTGWLNAIRALRPLLKVGMHMIPIRLADPYASTEGNNEEQVVGAIADLDWFGAVLADTMGDTVAVGAIHGWDYVGSDIGEGGVTEEQVYNISFNRATHYIAAAVALGLSAADVCLYMWHEKVGTSARPQRGTIEAKLQGADDAGAQHYCFTGITNDAGDVAPQTAWLEDHVFPAVQGAGLGGHVGRGARWRMVGLRGVAI